MSTIKDYIKKIEDEASSTLHGNNYPHAMYDKVVTFQFPNDDYKTHIKLTTETYPIIMDILKDAASFEDKVMEMALEEKEKAPNTRSVSWGDVTEVDMQKDVKFTNFSDGMQKEREALIKKVSTASLNNPTHLNHVFYDAYAKNHLTDFFREIQVSGKSHNVLMTALSLVAVSGVAYASETDENKKLEAAVDAIVPDTCEVAGIAGAAYGTYIGGAVVAPESGGLAIPLGMAIGGEAGYLVGKGSCELVELGEEYLEDAKEYIGSFIDDER